MADEIDINFDKYLKATLVRTLVHLCKTRLFLAQDDVRYHLDRFEAQIRRQRMTERMDALNTKIERAREQGNKQQELALLKEWSDLIAKDMDLH